MDYSRPERAERLAAEYVLGTLRGPARRRFETLLPAHPALRQAVAQWQQALVPLATSVVPVAPPLQVWQGVQTRLFGAAAAAPSLWQRLALWRGLSGFATAAAVAMFLVASQTPAPQAPVVVVLAANPQAALALNASFVASISGDGRALVLKPLNDLSLEAGRALELWAVPAQGAPRSLGLVQGAAATTLVRAQLLRDTAAFAVSVEPQGGSPTGAPTGPIVSVGKLQI
ncbi:MAG: anti-sigma factor [Rubrivivax sp.]|jgi:anti-sigma-K factor RskA|nr:anti-sigma factor [Rubrivivax sp.]MBK8529782.1 anti-sigma factor [Rubrivivax sp.]